MDFIRNQWLSLLVILLFLWLMLKPSGCKPYLHSGKDTIRVETKTEYIPQDPIRIPQYVPMQFGETQYVEVPVDRQPMPDISGLTKQYNDLLKDYLAVRNYRDSIQLKDSAGNRVGVVNLNDNVSNNKLISREPDYQLSFPHTTTTITIKEPPGRQLYIGGGLTGNSNSPVNGIQGGLIYKNKSDRLFGLSGGFQNYNGKFVPQFGISTYWKIKLK